MVGNEASGLEAGVDVTAAGVSLLGVAPVVGSSVAPAGPVQAATKAANATMSPRTATGLAARRVINGWASGRCSRC